VLICAICGILSYIIIPLCVFI